MFRRTASLCLHFALCRMTRENATFWGCAPRQKAITPKFELGRDFCTVHLPPSFIVLCLLVQKLSCWHTNPQIHKQMPPKTSNVLHYTTTLGKYTQNTNLLDITHHLQLSSCCWQFSSQFILHSTISWQHFTNFMHNRCVPRGKIIWELLHILLEKKHRRVINRDITQWWTRNHQGGLCRFEHTCSDLWPWPFDFIVPKLWETPITYPNIFGYNMHWMCIFIFFNKN